MAERIKGKGDAPKARRHSRTDLNPIARYIQELRMEWNKITFPERKELYRSTVVVFIFTVVFTMVIAVFDLVVARVFLYVLG
jgi:preprotein translocase SecE subunit